MEREPLLSVIVPVYNVEAYLNRCVDSILAQTYRNLEIILVDDGTKDHSDEICDVYAAMDSRVRVIHKENGGLSSARNAGLDIARGEYIGFVDSDDWIEPEMYAHMVACLLKYGAKVACAGRYDVYSATGERKKGLCPEREELVNAEEMVAKIFLWDNCDSAAWDKLYHRSLFEDIRYPLGKICEDVPTTYRLILKAGKAVLCDRPFYNYYHRPGSITTATAITEKNFHFSQHTAAIYPYIREHHPAIAKEARYLRVRSLSHILLLLDTAKEPVRKEFAGCCNELRAQLREHTGFILKYPRFGKKERITDLLLILDLYRTLRPVFTKNKSE